MPSRHPSTKASRIGTVSEIGPYVFFKHHGRWYRALRAAEKAPENRKHYGEWVVACLTAEGHTRTAAINGPEIELMVEGKIPGPFQPGTLRSKARKLEQQAQQLRERAQDLRTLHDVMTGAIPLTYMGGVVRPPTHDTSVPPAEDKD